MVTQSETSIDEMQFENFQYTGIVIIGGDGLLFQLLNRIGRDEQKEMLFKIPIGVVPGGSTNATACDLGGKNPYEACVNVIRGQTIP